jgi:hypothetical protein
VKPLLQIISPSLIREGDEGGGLLKIGEIDEILRCDN